MIRSADSGGDPHDDHIDSVRLSDNVGMLEDGRPAEPAPPHVVRTRQSMNAVVLMQAGVLALTAVMSGLAMFNYGGMFYNRYWRWRDCFDQFGRCTVTDSTGEQHYYVASVGAHFGWLAGFTAIVTVVTALLALRSLRRLTRTRAPVVRAQPAINRESGPPPLLYRVRRPNPTGPPGGPSP